MILKISRSVSILTPRQKMSSGVERCEFIRKHMIEFGSTFDYANRTWEISLPNDRLAFITSKTNASKATDSKADDLKTTDSKADDLKTIDSKADDLKTTDSKADDLKTIDSKADATKTTDLKTIVPKIPSKEFHNIIIDIVMGQTVAELSKIVSSSKNVYLVGGAVRDILRGEVPKYLNFVVGTSVSVSAILRAVSHQMKTFGFRYTLSGDCDSSPNVMTVYDPYSVSSLILKISPRFEDIYYFRCDLLKLSQNGSLMLHIIDDKLFSTTIEKLSLMQAVNSDIQAGKLVLFKNNSLATNGLSSYRALLKQTVAMLQRGWVMDGWTFKDQIGAFIEIDEIDEIVKIPRRISTHDPVADVDLIFQEAKAKSQKDHELLSAKQVFPPTNRSETCQKCAESGDSDDVTIKLGCGHVIGFDCFGKHGSNNTQCSVCGTHAICKKHAIF